jgi:hypothetical protein
MKAIAAANTLATKSEINPSCASLGISAYTGGTIKETKTIEQTVTNNKFLFILHQPN